MVDGRWFGPIGGCLCSLSRIIVVFRKPMCVFSRFVVHVVPCEYSILLTTQLWRWNGSWPKCQSQSFFFLQQNGFSKEVAPMQRTFLFAGERGAHRFGTWHGTQLTSRNAGRVVFRIKKCEKKTEMDERYCHCFPSSVGKAVETSVSCWLPQRSPDSEERIKWSSGEIAELWAMSNFEL